MIRVESVTKRFGALLAVDAVDFDLPRGEIVGFLGPNGAGKSTVMRMLATYLQPSAGRLSVDGIDVVERPLEVRRRIGYLAGDTPLYQEMRVDRFLAFVGAAQGLRGTRLADRLDAVIRDCELETALGKRIKACSTGYRKRVGLAAALIHDPPVLLLDEPTHGLDPLQVRRFRALLLRLREGRTILLSSHVISEVTSVSDRVLMIYGGKLLANGPVADLCRSEGLADSDLETLFVRLVERASAGRGGQRDAG